MSGKVTRRTFLSGSASLGVAVAASSALAACVGTGGSPTPEPSLPEPRSSAGLGPKTGTLKIATAQNEVTDTEIAAFKNKFPDVSIEKIVYDRNNPTAINAMFASGNPPDLVRGFGAIDTSNIVARGLATELDPYVKNSSVFTESDLAGVNDLWRYDGKVQGKGPRYGIVKDYSQDGMFWYNAEKFQAKGLSLPSDSQPMTFDEWLETAKKLTERDGEKIRTYGLSPFALRTITILMSMVDSRGGRLFSEDLSKVDFSSPEAKAALKWVIDFAKARVGPSVVEPNPDGWDGPTFRAGRLAMAGDGYWFGGVILNTKDNPRIYETSRLAPAPQFGSKRVSACHAAVGYWIPKKAKNPEAAWAFMQWYLGGDNSSDRAKSGWGLPALRSHEPLLPADKPFQKQALAVQKAELAHFSVLTFTPYATVESVDALIGQELPKAVAGGDAGTLADALNKGINELLKEGKDRLGR